jgi:hypothetical protein
VAQSITSLLAPLDPDQAIKDFLAVLALVTGSPADQWEPGDIAYDLTDTVTTWLCNQWNTWVLPALQAQFLAYASGAWLSYVAWAKYNRPRTEATFAVGDLVLENRGVGVGTIGVGTVRVTNATGQTFTNTTSAFMPLWIGSGGYPVVTLSMRADVAGSGSNTLANALPVYPTPPSAAPFGNLYVQSNAALLGADAEADTLLRRRCQLAAAERGMTPREFIEATARDPIGAMTRAGLPIPSTWPPTVNVTRVRIDEPGNGVVNVWLASPTGAAAGSTSTQDSDVYVCNTALQLLAAPIGGSLNVAPAVEHDIDFGTITISVKREANVDKATAEATAGVALAAFFSTLPVGGERLIAGGQGYALIEHVLSTATSGPGAFNGATSGVSTDVALAVSEVAVPTYTVLASVVTQGTG